MAGWIAKLFIKDYENTSDPKVRTAYGQVSGIIGILTNLLLVAGKLTVGLIAGSISIIGDALNNLADAGSSIVTLVGFRLSSKPADNEHPYGHARIEYVTGLIISMSVVFIGLQLAMESFDKIIHPVPSEINLFTLITLGIAILVKVWQGFFYRGMAKRIDSDTLRANSTDSFSDVILTSVVLIGALLAKFFGIVTDGWFGLAVAIFITIAGVKLIIETSDPLLGTPPSEELVKTIAEKVESYDGVLGYHDLVVHSYGAGNTFVSIHIEVDAAADVLVSHELIDNIEFDFKREMNVQLVGHLDPIVVGDERVDSLKEALREIIDRKYPGMLFHDFRVVFGEGHTNVIFDVVVPVSFPIADEDLCRDLCAEMQKHDPKLFTVITVDRDYTSTVSVTQ